MAQIPEEYANFDFGFSAVDDEEYKAVCSSLNKAALQIIIACVAVFTRNGPQLLTFVISRISSGKQNSRGGKKAELLKI